MLYAKRWRAGFIGPVARPLLILFCKTHSQEGEASMDDLAPKVEPLLSSLPEAETERFPLSKLQKAKVRAAAVGRRDLPNFGDEETEHHELDTMA